MKKSIIKVLLLTVLLVTTLSANSSNEFDLQGLGKIVESLYIKYNKKFSESDEKYEKLILELKKQDERIQKLEIKIKKFEHSKIKKIKQKIKILGKTTILKNTKIVNKKAGLDSYESPYNNAIYVKTYKFNELLNIESCNNRNWCKIFGKNEYVKKYLLR